jgi:DnaJ-class molecular chaperone
MGNQETPGHQNPKLRWIDCPNCNGTGRFHSAACVRCDGKGVIAASSEEATSPFKTSR